MTIAAKTIALGESASSGTFKEVSETLVVDRPNRVFLDLRPADIASYTREGQDLLVVTQGETLRIVDFYHSSGDSELYLKDDQGALLRAQLSPAATDGAVFAHYVPQLEASPFQSLTSGFAGLENYVLVALAGAGTIAAAAAFGGSSGGGSNTGPGTPVDTTPPAAVTAEFNADGSTALSELADLSLLHTNASNIQEGTAGDDILNGTAGSDRLYGYGGRDVLFGGSGSDTLNGGIGDDLIIVSHTGFAAVDGGEGFDTLKLDGGFGLDFSSLTGTVSNIERIDMGTGDTASTLTLTADAVTSLTDADNQLYISGDSFDTLNISGASASGQATVDGVTYNTYSFGINELLVETDVQVIA